MKTTCSLAAAAATAMFMAMPAGSAIVQIWDDSSGAGDWFSVQAAGGDIGRKVVVFDAYGPPSLFSYSGGDGSLRFEFDLAAGAFGVGPRSINNGVKTARAYYEANDIEAAGLQIEETENQVQVFIRAPDANKNRIEPELGEEILGDFDELKCAIGYGSD